MRHEKIKNDLYIFYVAEQCSRMNDMYQIATDNELKSKLVIAYNKSHQIAITKTLEIISGYSKSV